MNNLIYAILLFTFGQMIVWFQSNAQFLYEWCKNNPLILSFSLGGIASYVFIKATSFSYFYFNETLWPGRFIGFGIGMLVFAILTWLVMSEPINTKTVVSLLLATALLCVQIFWKS